MDSLKLDLTLSRRERVRKAREQQEGRQLAVWETGSRRRKERQRSQAPTEWLEYHTEQADRHRRVLGDLIKFHEEWAERLPKEDDG